MRKKKLLSVIIALMFMLTIAAVAVPQAEAAVTLTDINGHWAQTQIQNMVDKGVIIGYPDGSFKPEKSITRAEFMTMINRANGFTGSGTTQFSDVKSTDWFASAISVAAEAGYITGYPDGTMRPDNPISREEAATIIMKINKLEANPSAANTFTDAASLTWSKGAVGAVFAAGIMIGYPDGSFGPQKLIKRAEAAVALDRAMRYIAGPVTPLAPSVTRNDDTNTVSGMTTAMEYKLDSANYAPYVPSAFDALDFSGNHTLLVRFAASGINPFGPATTLTFTTNASTGGGGGGHGGSTTSTVAATAVAMTVNGADVIGSVTDTNAAIDLSSATITDSQNVTAIKITAPVGSTLTLATVNDITVTNVLSNLDNITPGSILTGTGYTDVSMGTLRSLFGNTLTLTGTLACAGYNSSTVILTITLSKSAAVNVTNDYVTVTTSGTTITATIKGGMRGTPLKDIGVRNLLMTKVGQIPTTVIVGTVSYPVAETANIQAAIATLTGPGKTWDNAILGDLAGKSIKFTAGDGLTYTINFI